MRNAERTCAVFTVIICSCLCSLTTAQEGQEKKAPAKDAEAKSVLSRVSEFYKGIKSIQTQSVMSMKMKSQGLDASMSVKSRIAAEVPNKFLQISEGSGFMASLLGGTTVCDGTNLYQYNPNLNQYSVRAAPQNLAQLIGGSPILSPGQTGEGAGAAQMLFSFLLLVNPSTDSFLFSTSEYRLLGSEQIDGTACRHISVTNPFALPSGGLAFDVWIEEGDSPLIRKIELGLSETLRNLKKTEGSAQSRLPGSQFPSPDNMEMSFSYNEWKIDEPIPNSTFQFVPPQGAQSTDAKTPLNTRPQNTLPGPSRVAQHGEHALTNKPAPPIILQTLRGFQFDLAEFKGKNILMVCFWASSSSASGHTLALFNSLQAEYGRDGAMLVAINRGESGDKINEVLKRSYLKNDILLDLDNGVSGAYGVDTTLQSFLIDKQGIVRYVQVGNDPNPKEGMRTQIKAAIASSAPVNDGRTVVPIPKLVSPEPGAMLANGSGGGGGDTGWDFVWDPVPGAKKYEIFAIGGSASIAAIQQTTEKTSFHHAINGYIVGRNAAGWTWKVRAITNEGKSEWSESRVFDVAPMK